MLNLYVMQLLCYGFLLLFIVCHAEYNAIINKGAVDPRGCTIYVTLFPCHECAKLLVQSGVVKVVYAEKPPTGDGTDRYKLAANLLERAGVSLW